MVVRPTKAWYDAFYEKEAGFRYHEWLYRPYLKAVLAAAGVRTGSTVLDAGCGQGFFANLIKNCGMRVIGVDISSSGITAARKNYGTDGLDFVVGDINTMHFAHSFDCVFTRSLSLYNVDDFSNNRDITQHLMGYLHHGGVFVFLYNTNLRRTNINDSGWRYHTLKQARKHFALNGNAKCFFTLRIDAAIFRQVAFNSFFSKVNSLLSASLGLGGEIVCIARKR